MTVNDGQQMSTLSAHTEAEVDKEEQKQKPSRKRAKNPNCKTAIVAGRHEALKAEVLKYWQKANPGVDMPWDGAEGAQLGMWMSASPNTTVEQFHGFLINRYKSEVNHAERPSKWMRSITSYAAGPLNQYGKPMNGANGNGKRHPAMQALIDSFAEDQDGADGMFDLSGGETGQGHDEPLRLSALKREH
jgi:hypothetical protein